MKKRTVKKIQSQLKKARQSLMKAMGRRDLEEFRLAGIKMRKAMKRARSIEKK